MRRRRVSLRAVTPSRAEIGTRTKTDSTTELCVSSRTTRACAPLLREELILLPKHEQCRDVVDANQKTVRDQEVSSENLVEHASEQDAFVKRRFAPAGYFPRFAPSGASL